MNKYELSRVHLFHVYRPYDNGFAHVRDVTGMEAARILRIPVDDDAVAYVSDEEEGWQWCPVHGHCAVILGDDGLVVEEWTGCKYGKDVPVGTLGLLMSGAAEWHIIEKVRRSDGSTD